MKNQNRNQPDDKGRRWVIFTAHETQGVITAHETQGVIAFGNDEEAELYADYLDRHQGVPFTWQTLKLDDGGENCLEALRAEYGKEE